MTAPSMPNLYFIIVDDRDEFLYRSFLLSPSSTNHVWGLRQHDEPIWKQLNTGDIICMMIEGDHQFTTQGKVLRLEINPDVPKQWSKNFRTSTMKYLIYFNDVRPLHLPKGEIINHAQDLASKHMPGLHKVKPDKSSALISKLMFRSADPDSIPVPIDLNGPPNKIKCRITRFIRDTQKSQKLKELYKNHCQICNYRIEINESICYSEVHHIWPLHDGGDDDFDNMVVLCPTHHAEFDYGVICIDISGTRILDKHSNKIGSLFIKDGHLISSKNIKHNINRLGLH